MKYMLMRNAMKAGFDWYAKYPKKDLEANVAFIPLSAKNSENRARSLATEGLDFPDQAKIVLRGFHVNDPIAGEKLFRFRKTPSVNGFPSLPGRRLGRARCILSVCVSGDERWSK